MHGSYQKLEDNRLSEDGSYHKHGRQQKLEQVILCLAIP